MNILIYSPVVPSRKSSGSLLLYQLLSLNKKDNFYCFGVVDPLRKIHGEYPGKNVQIKKVKRPVENAIRLTRSKIDEPIGFIFEKIKEFYINTVIVNRVVKYARENNIDQVWAILQGKTVISSALKISNKLNRPLICQVWDEPSWILKDTNLDRWSYKATLENYEENLTHCKKIACASFEMEKIYKKYNKPSAVLIGSLEKLPSKSRKKQSSEFTIGFAGQIYAKKEWDCLIGALDSLNWAVNGKKVSIKLLGKFAKNKFKDLPVEVMGYKSQSQVLKILSKTDFNYCPYWFDKEHENIARTSFPSKLTTYLATQRPVLFHGPSYASPAKFLQENNCGIFCFSLDREKLAKTILEVDSGNYSQDLIVKANHTFKKYLTITFQKKQFEKFLK